MPALLTTVARVQQALPTGTAAAEAQLLPLLEAASAALASHCRRDFGLGAWTEIRSGRGRETLRLRRYPVASIERVAVARKAALRIRHDDPHAGARSTPTGLTLLRTGQAPTTFTWVAHPTLQALAQAVNALGGGWSAAALEPFGAGPTTDLQPQRAPQAAAGGGAEFRVFDHWLTPTLDAAAGLLAGEYPQGADNIRIEYTAGFDPIPEDLQQACAALAAAWLLETRRDPTVARERVGDHDIVRMPPQTWPDAVRRLADPYRSVA